MKKYFYKGKLVRKSNSEKLNYKFLLVDKNDDSAGFLSSNKENLIRKKKAEIECVKRGLKIYEELKKEGKHDAFFNYDTLMDHLDFWENVQVRELDNETEVLK